MTLISRIKKREKCNQIHGDNIVATIRAVFRAAGLSIGFTKADISACYLHTGEAMALLMARVDPDTIYLVGRWQSDTILCYLQMTTKSFTEGLSIKMFKHSTYSLIPLAHSGN